MMSSSVLKEMYLQTVAKVALAVNPLCRRSQHFLMQSRHQLESSFKKQIANA